MPRSTRAALGSSRSSASRRVCFDDAAVASRHQAGEDSRPDLRPGDVLAPPQRLVGARQEVDGDGVFRALQRCDDGRQSGRGVGLDGPAGDKLAHESGSCSEPPSPRLAVDPPGPEARPRTRSSRGELGRRRLPCGSPAVRQRSTARPAAAAAGPRPGSAGLSGSGRSWPAPQTRSPRRASAARHRTAAGLPRPGRARSGDRAERKRRFLVRGRRSRTKPRARAAGGSRRRSSPRISRRHDVPGSGLARRPRVPEAAGGLCGHTSRCDEAVGAPGLHRSHAGQVDLHWPWRCRNAIL